MTPSSTVPPFKLCYVAYSALDLQSANSVQTYNTVRELWKQLGDHLSVIVPRLTQSPPPPFPAQEIARIPINKLSRLYPSSWYSYLERVLYAARAARSIQNHSPDLIYTRDIVCGYRFVQAGLPVLYEVHDLESQHPGQTRSVSLQKWVAQMDDTALRGARGIVSLTETFRHQVVSQGWQPPERVFVIPDAFDDAVYFPRPKMEMRATLRLPGHVPLIVYAGLTFKYRGLDVLLRALASVNDSKARLVLIGGRDFEVRELAQLARALGMADRVSFVPRQPADVIAQYLAAADVLVIPDTVTDATASPLKMFEYMAMARPIVCVERPSLREILGDAALYFPRGDAPALARALDQALLTDAQPLGEKARERSAHFTYTRRAQEIVRAATALLNV